MLSPSAGQLQMLCHSTRGWGGILAHPSVNVGELPALLSHSATGLEGDKGKGGIGAIHRNVAQVVESICVVRG